MSLGREDTLQNSNVVEVNNLTFSYRDSSDVALSDVTFSLEQGETLLVIGESGCGKTTLLQHLKPAYLPTGSRSAESTIKLNGKSMEEMSEEEQAFSVGYVGQHVDASQVTDKVWHELAFGLESLGKSQTYIRRRVAETAAFFGLENVFHEKLSELSGGQKQLVSLASVMAMEPGILILDEPTSQLDPISSEEFFRMVRKINDELGTTIIMAEHRLESIYAHATKVMVLSEGRIIKIGNPYEVSYYLYENGLSLFRSLPVSARLYYDLGAQADSTLGDKVPLTVNEGRNFLKAYIEKYGLNMGEKSVEPEDAASDYGSDTANGKEIVLSAEELWFRYKKNGRDILKACDIEISKGKITALLGGNGAGKSTLLYVLSGQLKSYLGKIKEVKGRVGVLPQEPKAMFAKKTVAEELGIRIIDGASASEYGTYTGEGAADFFGLWDCLLRHPFDLSGGQQQKLALAKLVAEGYDIFLLDEPGKGMDYAFKEKMGMYLRELAAMGKTILIVSHDVEFCAAYADYCGLFFDGGIVSMEEAGDFFAYNVFYTTAVRRMCSNIVDAVIYSDLIRCLGKDPYPPDSTASSSRGGRQDRETALELQQGRKLDSISEGSKEIQQSGITETTLELQQSGEIATALKLQQGGETAMELRQDERTEHVSEKGLPSMSRIVIPAIVFLVVMPLTIYLGHSVLHQRKYYFISLMLILEGIAAFMAGFERGKPKLKEIMTIAVMSAITALSRAAFYMIPAVKPMAALTIISGISLGGVSGFLVGALSMLVSDIFFGQGPWTPWQMFTMGLIGFLAGVVLGDRRDFDTGRRIRISVFGFITVFFVYGGIMNPASVLMYQENVNLDMLLAAYAPGIPIDAIHAVSTSVFLWIGAGPMLEKLERVRKK